MSTIVVERSVKGSTARLTPACTGVHVVVEATTVCFTHLRARRNLTHYLTILASDSVSVMDDMKMGDRVFIRDQPYLYFSKTLT